jgi:glycosyltransferase involved in cell wall biosynthesis
MKKILIVSFIPYPLNAGGSVAQFAVLEVLQHKMDVSFCAVLFSKEAETAIAPLQKLLPKVKIITAFNNDTGNKKKKKSFRRKSIESFKKVAGVFSRKQAATANFVVHDDFRNPKTNSPFDFKSEFLIKQLHAITSKGSYDIIQTEFHPFLELVNVFPENVPAVFVAHESRFLRLKSSYSESSLSSEYKDFIIKRNEVAEIGLMKKYAAVITFSDFDKEQLNASALDNVHTIPFPIIESEFLPNKQYEQATKIVFIGNEGHVPNKEGLLWYLQNCHQECMAQFGLPLTIIGNWNIKEEVLKQYKNVDFVGTVENLDDYYKQSILIVPIFKGSGIRTKILYGMAKKVPMVSTGFGASGIQVENGQQLYLSDTAIDFLNSIGNILNNSSQAQQMVDKAFDFAKSYYSQKVILNKRMELYSSLMNNKRSNT